MNKNLKTIILITISIAAVAFFGCRISTNDEYVVIEASTEVIELEESESEELEEEVSSEVNEDEKEKNTENIVADQDTKESVDEDRLMDALINFFNAVRQDNEYEYFSNATINIVGSKEEYKNGDKSDFYFIIKESHSNWENIEFKNIIIVDCIATVEIIGDRMAEGMKYEDEKVVFDFVKENDEWKIDFSS